MTPHPQVNPQFARAGRADGVHDSLLPAPYVLAVVLTADAVTGGQRITYQSRTCNGYDDATVATPPYPEYDAAMVPSAFGTVAVGDLVLVFPLEGVQGKLAVPQGSAAATGGSSVLIVLTGIFIGGVSDDAANCYVAATDAGQFYTYSWSLLNDSAGPPAVDYTLAGAAINGIPTSGTPCSWPAFHEENRLVPVMRASGLAGDVTFCPSGASIGYSFTLSGLTGTGAELNGLKWTLVYQGSSTWTGTQTTASGTCTATLTVTGAGAATLSFSGGAGNGLTYTLNPWVCTGNVTMNVGTNPYTAPGTLTLTALGTVPISTIHPWSVRRAWKGAGDYLLFSDPPLEDLFKISATTDVNGTVANFRYYDQSDPASGDGHGGTWQNGIQVIFIPAQ